MAIGLTATKPFAEKCRALRTLIGECVHAKVMAAFQTQKSTWAWFWSDSAKYVYILNTAWRLLRELL